MGESYLKRKLFSLRQRGAKKRSPISSIPSDQWPSICVSSEGINCRQQEMEEPASVQTTNNDHINSANLQPSTSMPQLTSRLRISTETSSKTRSQVDREKKMMTAIELIRNSNTSEEEEEEEDDDDDDEIKEQRLYGRGGEEEEDDKTVNIKGKRNLTGNKTKTKSKINDKTTDKPPKSFKSASKAIILFRRAAAALKNSTSSNSLSSSSPNTLFENHLSGLAFQRQNTGDSSTQSQVSSSLHSNYNLSSVSSIIGVANLRRGSNRKVKKSRSSSSSNNFVNFQDQTSSVACSASGGSISTNFLVPKSNALRMPLVCLVKSLDGQLMREVFVHRYELGQHLFDSLKVALAMEDCKFFGLKIAKSIEEQEDLRNPWLDLNESVCKQIKSLSGKGCLLYNCHNHNTINNKSQSSNNLAKQGSFCNTNVDNNISNPLNSQNSNTTINNHLIFNDSSLRSIDFYLRIKYYPPNLSGVKDPFLRQYLWLQLRRDLCLGKLISSMNNLTLLMACVLQYELGDYVVKNVDQIPSLRILPNQDLIEEQAIEIWRHKFVGIRKHQAQMKFLRAAMILETYGFDYYPVRDHQRQRSYLLGFNYAGIKTIRNGRIVHHLRWHNLSKISYETRMIIFHYQPTENAKRKHVLGFKCLSTDDCQSLYMRLLEQKYFFTVDLAYFDKSFRRPSGLYASQSVNGSANNNNNNNSNNNIQHNNSLYPQREDHKEFSTTNTTASGFNLSNESHSSPQILNNLHRPAQLNHNGLPESNLDQEDETFLLGESLSNRTDEEFVEDAWRRFRGRQDTSETIEPTQNNTVIQHQSNATGTTSANSTSIKNSIASKTTDNLKWTSKIINSYKESKLVEQVESVLAPQRNSNNNLQDCFHNQQQQQEESIYHLVVAKQLFKFCLLILLMNLLFHLCDSLSSLIVNFSMFQTTSVDSANIQSSIQFEED